jgi:cytochrome c oxidase assembly protein subunit 15
MRASHLILHRATERAVLFSRFAWGVLAYTLLVIVFGAFVRATGSGAGCGGHWPTCQGVIIPTAPAAATLIEYTHRLMSALSVLLAIAMVPLAWLTFGKGHPVRLGAVLTVAFTFTEALIGAGLVLLNLVAKDQSVERAISQALHLTNTLILLAAVALTAWWASGRAPVRLAMQGKKLWLPAAALVGMVVLDITGAITALGDTLFPAASLAAGLQQDVNAGSSFLIHLRVIHPMMAVIIALYSAGVVWWIRAQRPDPLERRVLLAGLALFGLQLVLGATNVLLLAPVWLQLVHLLVADLVWLTVLFSTALVLEDKEKIPALRFAASG